MDENLKAWWFKMPEAKLVNHLSVKLKYPPGIVSGIIAQVKAEREAGRRAKIKATQLGKVWDVVLAPAKAELQTVRTMKSQTKRTEPMDNARWNALCHYETVLQTTIQRLQRVKKLGAHNPAQFVQYLRTKGKWAPRGAHDHWTDWVKPSDKREVINLFNSLKPSVRGKTKLPFERRIPTQQFKVQRVALFERLNTELENAEQDYAMTNDADEKARLDALIQDMHRAQYLLTKAKNKTALPSTWHGLLTESK